MMLMTILSIILYPGRTVLIIVPKSHPARSRSPTGGDHRALKGPKAGGALAPVTLDVARADAAAAKAQVSDDQALIAHLKLQIAKLKRERFGTSSERTSRLLDQLELQLEELEASATEDELAAEQAAARATTTVKTFTRKKPSRQPFRTRPVMARPSRYDGSRLRLCGR